MKASSRSSELRAPNNAAPVGPASAAWSNRLRSGPGVRPIGASPMITSTRRRPRAAVVNAVAALTIPGPRLSTATPNPPLFQEYPSAAISAAES